jgi:hypothetical protein
MRVYLSSLVSLRWHLYAETGSRGPSFSPWFGGIQAHYLVRELVDDEEVIENILLLELIGVVNEHLHNR